ncbi:hypothetical protein Tco_0063741, partial [Tanacetum coccineum]
DDEDEDEEDEDEEDEEEEEENLAPVDSAVFVPTVELVSPPKGTKPVIPPPSTDITTNGARITVRLQASISLSPEEEVERLLALRTLTPSLPISLSPPSAGERLARCTAPPAHSSPPPVPSPLLPSSGCHTQIQTPRIASTQALIDAVTAALPSPWERIVGLAHHKEAYASRKAWAYAIGLSQAVHYELQTHRKQQAEMAELRETDRRHQAQIVETLCVMRDMRRKMGDMQAELLAL